MQRALATAAARNLLPTYLQVQLVAPLRDLLFSLRSCVQFIQGLLQLLIELEVVTSVAAGAFLRYKLAGGRQDRTVMAVKPNGTLHNIQPLSSKMRTFQGSGRAEALILCLADQFKACP